MLIRKLAINDKNDSTPLFRFITPSAYYFLDIFFYMPDSVPHGIPSVIMVSKQLRSRYRQQSFFFHFPCIFPLMKYLYTVKEWSRK